MLEDWDDLVPAHDPTWKQESEQGQSQRCRTRKQKRWERASDSRDLERSLFYSAFFSADAAWFEMQRGQSNQQNGAWC